MKLFILLLVTMVATSAQSGAGQSERDRARVIENGSGLVGVNPAQPYRPIPLNHAQSRETIFEFYFRALNPHQIQWGNVIERRLKSLAEESIGNPYFRLCALESAVIILLLVTCWLWWDKLRQVKVVAAESLSDALNARAFAEAHALEAIETYNRHMDACNRVIESQELGVPAEAQRNVWRLELDELRTKLTKEQAENSRLTALLQQREEQQAELESRISQLEAGMRAQHGTANAELVARLQRAESQLGSGRARK